MKIYDKFSNLVDKDEEFNHVLKIIAKVSKNSNKITRIGGGEASIKNGTAIFENFIFYGESYSNLEILIYLIGNSNLNKSIEINTKSCKNGDIYTKTSCITCSKGFYSINDNTTCKKCPNEANCLGGNLITPKIGFWRYNNFSDKIIPCKIQESCLENSKCKKGYYGNLCFNCEKGYGYVRNHECVSCKNSNEFYFYFFISFIFIFVVLVIKKNSIKSRNISQTYIKLLINHFSFLIIISAVNLNWTKVFSKYNEFLDVFLPNSPKSAFTFDCFFRKYKMENIYKYNLIIITTSPILLTIFIFIFEIIFRIILLIIFIVIKRGKNPIIANKKFLKRNFQLKFLIIEIFKIFIAVYHNVDSRVLTNFLQLFQCVNLFESKLYLEKNTQIECFSTFHINILKITIPLIITWNIVTPLLFLLYIFKYKNLNFNEKEKIKEEKDKKLWNFILNHYSSQKFKKKKFFLIKFFIGDYKKNFFYWEIIIILRKSFLSLIVIGCLSLDQITQGGIIIFCFSLFLLLNERYKPFINKKVNFIDDLSLITCIITVASGIIVTDDNNLFLQIFALVIALFFNFIYLVMWNINYFPIIKNIQVKIKNSTWKITKKSFIPKKKVNQIIKMK